MMKRIVAALAGLLALALPSAALAQCSGIFTAGYFCGNSTASGGFAGAASPTAMFDRAFGNVDNSTVVRLSGVWTVLSSANSGVWITSAAGVPSISSTLPNAVQDNITRLGTIANITTPLGLAFGGTAANLTASTGGLVYSAVSGFAILAGTATAGQIPRSGSSAAPSWSTATYPATAAAGTILGAASSNVIAGTATPTLGANGGTGGQITLNGSTSGSAVIKVPAAAGTTNFQLPVGNGSNTNVLQTDGSGNTSWTAAGAGTVTSAVTAAGTGISVSGTCTITTTGTCTVTNSGVVTVKKQVFSSSGTYTPSTGMIYAVMECVGAGGGGGGSTGGNTQESAGGGGGAGSYSRTTSTAATIGASQTITIGAAGTAGAVASTGGAGGDTSVGALCVGKGGAAGGGAGANAGGISGTGGVAGTGDFTNVGMPGGTGTGSSAVTTAFPGAFGASSIFGGGASPVNAGNSSVGNAGQSCGGGGGGGTSYANVNGFAGGAGFKGCVYVTEYNSQ